LYGRRFIRGRNPKYAASVSPQHEHPDMMVPIVPPIIPIPVFWFIFSQGERSFARTKSAKRKSGNPKIIRSERNMSNDVVRYP
jgi:hypothetical protein